MVYCPAWMFDVAAARVAYEFLHADLPIDSFAEKYSSGLADLYETIDPLLLNGSALGMLEFLSEIDAGEGSADLLNDFCFFRTYFVKLGVPRKMKPMFGSIEDASKQKEYSESLAIKGFKAHTYRLRTNPEEKAPSDWRLEEDENLPTFGELVGKTVSIIDAL